MRVMLFFLLLCGHLFSQKDTTKLPLLFLDVNSGGGAFVLGRPIKSEPAFNKNIYDFSNVFSAGINLGVNCFRKSSKKNANTKRVYSAGLCFNYLSYKINRELSDYTSTSHQGAYTMDYIRNKFSYTVDKLSYGLFLSRSTFFNNGLFLSNKLGLTYATFINKKEISIDYHTVGSTLKTDNTIPGGYSWDNYDTYGTIKEKNYQNNEVNLFYALSIGITRKKITYYASGEFLMLNVSLNSIMKLNLGIMVLL